MSDVIVIGGGITGLSAGWEIQRTNPNLSVAILEASDRWGGKIVSREMTLDNGSRFLVEGGPDTLITRKPEAWEMAQELGISGETVSLASETKDIYVLYKGSAHAVPLSPSLFVKSKLLSPQGKLRLFAEPFQSARRDDGDESLADFVTRRLGREASERFIGPVLGGIYNTDPRQQSILVSSPVMREMEKEAGSLVLAAVRRGFKRKPKNGPRPPRFINFRLGLQQLTDTFVSQLHTEMHLNSPVTSIMQDGELFAVRTPGATLKARAVILTTLAHVSAKLVGDLAPFAAQKMNLIPHQNIGTISLVYREADIPAQPVINGLMIPRSESRAIDAVTVSSRKLPERCAPGYAVLRVFIGGSKPDAVMLDEDALLQLVKTELCDLLGIAASPLTHTVFRWEQGFPQARVGHLDLIDEIERDLPRGLYLAGSSYRGIAVPDCIRQGREAAKKAIQDL